MSSEDPDRWRPLVERDHPDSAATRSRFLEAYRAAGSPAIGVILNRGLLDRDRAMPEVQASVRTLDDAYTQRRMAGALTRPFDPNPASGGPGTYVVFLPSFTIAGRDVRTNDASGGGGAGPGAKKTGAEIEEMLDTVRMEDLLYQDLLRSGVTMKDPAFVRSVMDKQARERLFMQDRQIGDRLVMEESELTSLLTQEAKAAGLDILIVGTGRLVTPPAAEDVLGGLGDPAPAPADAKKVRYTFRAVRLADGATLAAQAWSEDIAAEDGEVDASLPGIAQFAAGHLLDQLWATWAAGQALATQPADKTQW